MFRYFFWVFVKWGQFSVQARRFCGRAAPAAPKPIIGLSERYSNCLSILFYLISLKTNKQTNLSVATKVGNHLYKRVGVLLTWIVSLSPQWMTVIQMGTELCFLWTVAERTVNRRGTGCRRIHAFWTFNIRCFHKTKLIAYLKCL